MAKMTITLPQADDTMAKQIEFNHKETERVTGVPKSLTLKHYRYVCAGCTNNAGFFTDADPMPTSLTCQQCGKIQPFSKDNLIEI